MVISWIVKSSGFGVCTSPKWSHGEVRASRSRSQPSLGGRVSRDWSIMTAENGVGGKGINERKKSISTVVMRWYRRPGVLTHHVKEVVNKSKEQLPAAGVSSMETEHCYNIEIEGGILSEKEKETLEWLLKETYEPEATREKTWLNGREGSIVEVGPRLSFESALSSNAKSICWASGLTHVKRVEVSRRWLVRSSKPLSNEERSIFVDIVSDRMTEMEYAKPLVSFKAHGEPEAVEVVPVLEKGIAAIEEINQRRGLGFDDWDIKFYFNLFNDKLKRNPTDVELFDMGQANSEHSRHWFFSGKMVINGKEKPTTLFRMVKDTLPKGEDSNSIIAFHDNSSAIRGSVVSTLGPQSPGKPGPMEERNILFHPILTAETHNFPSGVAPFPGAETGTGGRLRDVMATGRGAHPIAGISSYSVGNLRIPGYEQPWEEDWEYAPNLASPLRIEVEASNGASDYGNKFGEPVVHGFSRSFGQRLPNGERYEYVKPIMFSAGIGRMDGAHVKKGEPEKNMWVVKVGGPCYRIGLGGGAASSRVGDASTADLDFNAVQRGDAEMENRLNRLLRACIELGESNPIISIHDQGAGGNGNVLKEIVEPAGAKYDIRNILIGDETLSVLEIWGAEYQENNALLIRPESVNLFMTMAKRENCPCSLLGQVTGDGRVTVIDSQDGTTPYDLPLSDVLGDLPQKTFTDTCIPSELKPLNLPEGMTPESALTRVLHLMTVGSKRFLTNKVDRSVTGLVAQQQCVGPLQMPLANCAVLATSHFDTVGIATSCGEQPIKGLVNQGAMARMTVVEGLTNLMWAKITSIRDVRASGNWMWAAKLPGELCQMWDACEALKFALLSCGVGIDGGKDSLSMAAKCGDEIVKSPGTLVMTLYAACTDVTLTVMPDLKLPGTGQLIYIDFSAGKGRLGGTSLAQVYSQVGNESPDVTDFQALTSLFEAVQTLIQVKAISAGHDKSDGGLIVTLVEMAAAGNVGIDVDVPLPSGGNAISALFNEEAGVVIEVDPSKLDDVMTAFNVKGVPSSSVHRIGSVTTDGKFTVRVGGQVAIQGTTAQWRDVWEETSFELEKRQCNVDCVAQEQMSLTTRKGPSWKLTYEPQPTPKSIMDLPVDQKPKVCVLRQEGSNGDQEMLSAFHAAGFEAWDVTTSDLQLGRITLDQFRGIAFVGGFSFADVLDSAKGWMATISFSENVAKQFEDFRKRTDTFSLGVCNGCQLMAMLGWVPGASKAQEEKHLPRFIHNDSGRFESRFSSLIVGKSPAIMLKGMEGSRLGVWVAHGEGKLHVPERSTLDGMIEKNLCCLSYVDESGEPTEAYPDNPNGSPFGITGVCSEDGRHLAMMPHPERCFTTWQWPYMPSEWKDLKAGPWLKIFQNAYAFCKQA